MAKIWISFKDEHNRTIEGFFNLVEQSKEFVRIESEKNEFTIPYHRILKIKKEKEK